MKLLLILLHLLSFSLHAKLSQIASQLECLKGLHSLDEGRNQDDIDYFGIQIRNRVGAKSLLLDRKNNEYIIYTENEVRVCPIPKNLKAGHSIRYLSSLPLKILSTEVAVEADLSKNSEGKVTVNSVAFGAKKDFPLKEVTDIQCFDKINDAYNKKLETFSKHRIEMARKHCLSLKGANNQWSDSLDEKFCKDAFSYCAESEKLKYEAKKAIEALFPQKRNSNRNNSSSNVLEN